MTKEALEKEAEEYARKTLSKDCCDLKLVVYKRTINSYLAGAEPREQKLNEAKDIISNCIGIIKSISDSEDINISMYDEDIDKAENFLKE